MNPLLAKTSSFALGCACTAVGWMLFRPDPPDREPEPSARGTAHAHARAVSWKHDDIGPALANLSAASSRSEEATAALRLARIPGEWIPEALARATLIENGQLTLQAKTLLIRWGETDGESAMQWAWEQLRSDGQFDQAFRQIGPAWAWTDPEGFANWVSRSIKPLPSASTEPGSDAPPKLDFSAISRASRWLAPEAPLLATKLFKQRGGWSSDDSKFPQYFKTVAQVREALEAFDNLDQLSPLRVQGDQFLALGLLARWRELDPTEFGESPWASLTGQSGVDQMRERTEEWLQVAEPHRADAAARLLADSEPEHRAFHVNQLTSQWTKTDPEAAVEWINSLPEADRNMALRTYSGIRAASDLQGTIDWIGGLSNEGRAISLAVAFDAWRAQPESPRLDQSAWPPSLQQAWSDLEALLPEPVE